MYTHSSVERVKESWALFAKYLKVKVNTGKRYVPNKMSQACVIGPYPKMFNKTFYPLCF